MGSFDWKWFILGLLFGWFLMPKATAAVARKS